MNVPAPPSVQRTAEQLVAEIHERGGRTYRALEPPVVICLTDDAALAAWIELRGGHAHVQGGSYLRARDGSLEWDFTLQAIPVAGEQTIWEAAAR